jgi:uncharacterized damage-inducible protein DinB
MSHFIFTQLEFVRKNTLDAVEGISNDQAHIIPKGFKNNILWHLGHIYVVQEKFTFATLDLPMELSNEFNNFFAPGTTPSDWNSKPPTIGEITLLLQEQNGRIRNVLENRLNEKVNHPFTTKTGLKLETVAQFLSFNLYHEGVHVSAIKNFKIINGDQ